MPLAATVLIPFVVALVATQALTFRAGSARRSAAQPLVFLAGLLLSPFVAPAVVFVTHLLGRGLLARLRGERTPAALLVAGGGLQALRALAVSVVRVAVLPPAAEPQTLLLVLLPLDLAVAATLWFSQRRMRDRRRAAGSELLPLFGGEALGDAVGWLAFAAGASPAAVLLAAGWAATLGLLGIRGEQGRIAERHFSGFLGSGDVVASSGVEEFLESFGRALRRVVRPDRIELILYDEEGAPAGGWSLRGEESVPLPEAPSEPAGELDLAVDTPDSFVPAALASPDPLPRRLEVPIVDGRRILGLIRIESVDLPRLDARPRKLLETLLRQATAVLRALRLQRLATTDPLTGLAIRRLFDLRLAEATARARGGRTASLVLVDVDHFKAVNDRFGHPAGDEVLRTLGRLLRESVRGRDLAARLGGEEFALLLHGTSPEGAVVAADRIRARLAALEIILPDGTPLGVTASFGVASIEAATSPSAVVAAADRALYEAKHGGRNRVVATSSSEAAPAARKTGPTPRQLG